METWEIIHLSTAGCWDKFANVYIFFLFAELDCGVAYQNCLTKNYQYIFTCETVVNKENCAEEK